MLETLFPGPTDVTLLPLPGAPMPTRLKIWPVVPAAAVTWSPAVHVAPAPPTVPLKVVLFCVATNPLRGGVPVALVEKPCVWLSTPVVRKTLVGDGGGGVVLPCRGSAFGCDPIATLFW